MEEYTNAVNGLKAKMEQFMSIAAAAAEGKGSKTKGLEARKLSNEITKDLKNFRVISLNKDKAATK